MTQYCLALEFMLGNSGTKLPDVMERSVGRGRGFAALDDDVFIRFIRSRVTWWNVSDVNVCDDESEPTESPDDVLPKRTNFYALRKVVRSRVDKNRDFFNKNQKNRFF